MVALAVVWVVRRGRDDLRPFYFGVERRKEGSRRRSQLGLRRPEACVASNVCSCYVGRTYLGPRAGLNAHEKPREEERIGFLILLGAKD